MSESNAIPQYRQVADTLRRRIRNGVYQPGDIIPPASVLERRFAVSNITIRKALAILSQEKLVAGRRGVGTVVLASLPSERVTIIVSGDFNDWLESAGGKNLPIEQRVLDIRTGNAPPAVARMLGLAADAPVWAMQRLRRIHGAPISYHVNYGHPERLGAIRAHWLDGGRSFAAVMREDCAIALARMEQTVEARTADRDLAEMLGVGFGMPVFFVENIYYDEDDGVIALTHLHLRGDRYAYRTSIRLDPGASAADRG